MRVAVFGASGLLGRDLVHELRGHEVSALSSRNADLRDRVRVRDVIVDSRPDWIILSAAYTDVDGCESNRDLAFAVNCDGAVNVALAARETGSRLLFLSSDYVFDGRKRSPYETRDVRNPTSVYGATKAQAEAAASRDSARRLHRPDFMAVRARRQVFSCDDSQAGVNSS